MIRNIYLIVKNYSKFFFLKPSIQALNALPNNGEVTLADIGAAGEVEPRWKNFSKNLNYLGFEPDKRSIKIISNKKNDFKSYKILPYALAEKSSTLKFRLCKKPQVSSLYQPNSLFLDKFPNTDRFDVEETVLIDCVSIDSINLPKIEFLKIDIQGGENDVLKGASSTLESVLGLEVEVEFLDLYKGQPLFGDVCNTLLTNEIEFIDFINLTRWERKRPRNGHGQCIFGDALFLRSPEYLLDKKVDINTWSSYLAILIIYNRFDLIEVVLDLLPIDLKKKFKKFELLFIKAKSRERFVKLIHSFLNRCFSFLGECYRLHLIR
jgi:FkbM family methyltransferase